MNGEYCRFCQTDHDGSCPHPARQTFIDLREERDTLLLQVDEDKTVIDCLKASDRGYAAIMASHEQLVAELVREREKLKTEVQHVPAVCASAEEAADEFARQSYAMKLKMAALQNELCTATDHIPPDMEGDSLSVALIKLNDARDSLVRQLVEANGTTDRNNDEHAHASESMRRTLFQGIKERDVTIQRLENAATHWQDLYRACAQEKMDEAARYGQEIVDLEAVRDALKAECARLEKELATAKQVTWKKADILLGTMDLLLWRVTEPVIEKTVMSPIVKGLHQVFQEKAMEPE